MEKEIQIEIIPEGVSGTLTVKQLMNLCPGMTLSTAKSLLLSETTEPEEWYLQELVKELKTIGYEGFIEVNTIGVVVTKHRNGLIEFDVRRFDILLPDAGIAVEVDGSSHWLFISKMRSDETREHFYSQLGLHFQRVDNGDVCIPIRRIRDAKELAQLVSDELKKHKSGFKKIHAMALAKGRFEFYSHYAQVFRRYFPRVASSDSPTDQHKWHHYYFGKRIYLGSSKRKRGKPKKHDSSDMITKVRRYIIEHSFSGKKPNLNDFCKVTGYAERTLREHLKCYGWSWRTLVQELIPKC